MTWCVMLERKERYYIILSPLRDICVKKGFLKLSIAPIEIWFIAFKLADSKIETIIEVKIWSK